MSYEFRMPNVSGTSTENQVRQIVSFLRQHIQELNYVVGKLENSRRRPGSRTIKEGNMEEEKKELLENAAGVTGVTKPGAYTSQWQGQLSDAIGKILDRKEFSYDVNSDALYQQYKDRYVQGGKMAMMDTLGQAATLTGGYGNSYAQAAGQQAYQGYLQGLY